MTLRMQLRRPALDGKGPILEGPTLQDVHEGTAFKDSQPSTKALPLWLGLAMVVEVDGSDSTF